MIFSNAKITMKKLLLILLVLVSVGLNAQSRGVKIGYIDMEYILQNVPEYTEAKNQLEQKAQKWKQEIATKNNDVLKLKEALKTEKVLLTKELIEEREEEIRFQESELSDFQQKRFGPAGDLMIQKAVLVKPIQDQVFTAAQDIAEAKKFDFIFDKSSDMTMLFAAKRYDLSDQVIRVITRATKRDQMSKKQLKEEQVKEALEDMVDENPALQERQKKLDDKKAAREKLVADKKAAAAEKKRLNDEKRQQMLAEKVAKKNGTALPPKAESVTVEAEEKITDTATAEDPKKKAAAERAKVLEDKKKAAADRKVKILADREAAKKAKEDKNSKKEE